MLIPCSKCSHELRLGNPAPGRFYLTCPSCAESLELIVPEAAGQPPTVAPRKPAGRTPADRQPVAVGSDEGHPPAPSPPNSPEPNANITETLAATWVTGFAPDENPHPGAPREAVQETIDASQIGESDLATARDAAPTLAQGGFHAESGVRTEAAREPDSDAGFLSAVRKAAEPQLSTAVAIPATLGGYKVLKELGRGGMGAVYLARQLSLDRNVALKVVAPKWARDATFLARFTREAYAAAQLVHHNIVQIYDLGADKNINYFSMEFVEGQTLAELVQTEGAVPPDVAASHILQAARGLKVAHDHGLIHRDIKPENLMLSRHGVVKVADLGLVKSYAEPAAGDPLSDEGPPMASQLDDASDEAEVPPGLTRVNKALGTPAYMAPEQARDAAHVGCRADIYSLGCTLYALVTGRPPFQGKTVMELITKHAMEPVVPPDVVVDRVPKALSEIILKMVAKDPSDRYATIDDVIVALEGFLKVGHTAPLTPAPDEAEILETYTRAFELSPALRAAKAVFLAFLVTCCAGTLLALLGGNPLIAAIIVGVGIVTPLAYGIVNGIARRTPLYTRVRQFVLESGLTERIAIAACLGLVVLALLIIHAIWLVFLVFVASTLLAVLAFVMINRNLERARREPLERIQNALKTMRLRGIDEETLRRFIAERCGPRWDALQNALFGDEGKLATLGRWRQAEWERTRPKLAVWRDAVLAWFETQLRARQQIRERRYLQQVEELSLKAQGMGFFEARRKARLVSDVLVAQAGELRAAGGRATSAVIDSLRSDEARQRLFRTIRESAERPEQFLASMERGLLARRSDHSLDALIGPRSRFFAGVALILGYLIWAFQNGLANSDTATKPLWLPLIPSFLTAVFRDVNSLVAGLLLVGSALIPGWRISLTIVPAAAIALLGTTFGLPAWLCLLAAVVVAALGLAMRRNRAGAAPLSDDGHV